MSKSKWLKRSLAIGIASSMIFTAACTGGGEESKKKSGSEEMAEEQVLTTARLKSEPPALDPAKAEDSSSGTIVRSVMEGLARVDENGIPEPGVAEKWEISEDGKKITFHLRDTKWSNGDAVTAGDFEYAWKRVLDPKTAAPYAYQLHYLKNGKAYNEGKGKAEDVGVKAVDDKTLEVELEKPAPYFVSLTAFYTLMPVNKKVVEENAKWGTEADSYVSNGPFVLDTWEHDKKVVLKKNDNYYGKDRVKLDQINMPVVPDEQTGLQQFDTGEFDEGDKTIIPADLADKLIKEEKAVASPIIGTYAYEFNVEKEPFTNSKIRKAFSMAIDRKSIVENVSLSGEKPATGWIPWEMPDVHAEKPWLESGDYKPFISETAQAEDAKKLLEEGMKEEGYKELPDVTLSYNTSDGHKKIAEAVQQMLKKNLGVDVKLKNSEWKVFLEEKGNGDFQMARFGWLPDYIDPMTFMDMYETDSGQNDPSFSNKEYDKLIKEAKSTIDQEVRMEAMRKAEQVLMDEMPVAPVYFYTESHMSKDYVKDVVYTVDGQVDFSEAYITKH
ncbi:peptide ABC transporter substrate-binding protein [Mechercharimyces sp. CAU 1602]|uniref:peptide ABC transporter substrate-binding protein n=1 Tax=Mechercharimyces sp. CAU 1602 TaxID=2973933 RepID=UPI0021624FB9|nr:peptide ABC transporter substrate-binding protein [Mechercharimyces sp. CAU 1602]MCS1351778.1 peptide ABC transporter substrate-binding protein [Mechercharimyces sp. CAU 1602]